MRRESVLGSCAGPAAARCLSLLSRMLPHFVFLVDAKESLESWVESEDVDLREGDGDGGETMGGGGRGPAAEPLQKSRMRASWYWSISSVVGCPWTGLGLWVFWPCARVFLLDENMVQAM